MGTSHKKSQMANKLPYMIIIVVEVSPIHLPACVYIYLVTTQHAYTLRSY